MSPISVIDAVVWKILWFIYFSTSCNVEIPRLFVTDGDAVQQKKHMDKRVFFPNKEK